MKITNFLTISILPIVLANSVNIYGQVSDTVHVGTPGTLSELLTAEELSTITNLKLTGSINNEDFLVIRSDMPELKYIDLEDVSTVGDSIPSFAFYQNESITQIKLPSSITRLGIYAFAHTAFDTINLPSNVHSIGYLCFGLCDSLKSVTLPSSLVSIEAGAFTSCTGLDTLILPASLTDIGSCAFNGCSGLSTMIIPSSVTIIEDCTFNACTGLTSINIPSQISFIGDFAFGGCTGLTSFTIPSSLDSMGNYVFQGCTGLYDIVFQPSAIEVGEGTFQQCTALTEVTLPASLSSINKYTFTGCSGLKTIDIPSTVVKIDDYAFNSCIGLSSVTLPASLDSIGELAFFNCKALASVSMPNSLKCIGGCAFGFCDSLSSVSIPASVTRIEERAFYACSNISSFTVNESNNNYSSIDGVLFNKEKTALIQYAPKKTNSFYRIPSTVHTVAYGAFSGAHMLKGILIPSSVVVIDERAFDWCESLQYIKTYRSSPIDLSSGVVIFSETKVNEWTLFVPQGSGLAYDNADHWTLFGNIVEYPLELSVVPGNTILADTAGSTTTIKVNSTMEWNIVSDHSWLVPDIVSGVDSFTVTLTAEGNPSSDIRETIITISSTSGIHVIAVTIQQSGMPTAIADPILSGMKIYPIPVEDILHIDNVGNRLMQLFSLQGNMVRTKYLLNDFEILDMSGLTPGVYLLKIAGVNGSLKITKD